MTNEQIRNLSRRDLSRALASARSRRDTFAAGREPADVLAVELMRRTSWG